MIRVLNVGEGDLKLTFDPNNKEDQKRAKSTIEALLKQGFAIMVEVGKDEKGPLYRRVTGYDPDTATYIVMGEPELPAKPTPAKRGRPPKSRVPSTAPAVAIGRSAGGYDPVIVSKIRRGGLAEHVEAPHEH